MSVVSIDIGLIALIGFFAVRGIHRGFVRGVLDLFVFLVAGRLGIRLAPFLVVWMEDLGFGSATPAIALGLATIAIGLGCLLLITLALRSLARFPIPPPLPFLDAIFGLAPGMVKGMVAAIAIVVLLVAFAADLGLRDQVRSSRLAPLFYNLGQQAMTSVSRQLDLQLPTGELPLPGPTTDLPLN